MPVAPQDILSENQVAAAPMAGVTDRVFRTLAREAGCGLVVTEMVSAKALVYNNQHTYKLVDIADEQQPVSVQLFGAEPRTMAQAAEIVERLGAGLVDINMGCPTPKIVKNGEGSALMRRPELAADIVAAVRRAVSIPLTVKIRAGWDEGSINAPEFAQRMESAGADMVTVHGRTRQQFYAGAADWGIIREVVSRLSIPVVGNGDIWEAEDAGRMLEVTGCAGVMIGRGALGNPWLFKETAALLKEGKVLPPPSADAKISMAIRHGGMLADLKGEAVAVKEMRKHVAWYIKGLRNAAAIRRQVNQLDTMQQVNQQLTDYLQELQGITLDS